MSAFGSLWRGYKCVMNVAQSTERPNDELWDHIFHSVCQRHRLLFPRN